MFRWLIYDAGTGAQIRLSETNDAGEGEVGVERPGSSMSEAPSTLWNAAARAFLDAARWMKRFEWIRLWTQAERAAVRATTDEAVADYWMQFSVWEGPVNINDPLIGVGIAAALDASILTEARAARIAAGLPPVV